jgi:hypothetical protein
LKDALNALKWIIKLNMKIYKNIKFTKQKCLRRKNSNKINIKKIYFIALFCVSGGISKKISNISQESAGLKTLNRKTKHPGLVMGSMGNLQHKIG